MRTLTSSFAALALAGGLALLALVACENQTDSSFPPPTVTRDAGGSDAGGDSGASSEPGTPRQAGRLRVATFNVRRFFDTVCQTGACAAGDFEEAPTKAAFDAKTAALAKAIALVDPDVISLQEVETEACLDALATELSALGRPFAIARLGETGYKGSLDVAVLSRGVLGEVRTHRDTPLVQADGTKTTFTRELLEVRMTFGAEQVVVFSAHFRSQATDDAARRLAEAKGAQSIVAGVAKELPGAITLLAGDLNDTPGSPPIDALEAGGALVRVAKDIPVEDQATYVYQGTKNAIDHVFVAATQASRYIPKSATVHRDGSASGFGGSDHAALSASFSIE